MIREIKEYVDDEGKKVTAFEPLPHSVPDGDVQYRGSVGIMTPRGILPIEFPFPEGYTLDQCFKEFEKEAEAAVEQIQKEAQEKNLIVTPDQMAGGAPVGLT